jgi:hypothetical protein
MDTHGGRSMDSHPRISRMTWAFGTPAPGFQRRHPTSSLPASPTDVRPSWRIWLSSTARRQCNLPLGAFRGSVCEHLGRSGGTNGSVTALINHTGEHVNGPWPPAFPTTPSRHRRRRCSCRSVMSNGATAIGAPAGWSLRRFVTSTCILFAVAWVVVAGGQAGADAATTPPGPSSSSRSTPSAPLSAPKTSVAQEEQFLTKVTEADPALASYEEKTGNVALRALLTDGTAFCAFLQRGAGIDNALASVAIGARGDEAKTHLPLSVTTFNSIEAVALLTLCSHDQKLLPPSDRSRLRKLGGALSMRAG